MSTPSRVNTVSLERKDITITMMMGVTPLTPVPRFFVLGDSNGDAAAAEELYLPFIMARKQDDPAELNIGARTIHPSMSLLVDGNGGEIPELTKKILNN